MARSSRNIHLVGSNLNIHNNSNILNSLHLLPQIAKSLIIPTSRASKIVQQ